MLMKHLLRNISSHQKQHCSSSTTKIMPAVPSLQVQLHSHPLFLMDTRFPHLVHWDPKRSFTAQYCQKEKTMVNELKEYFKLLIEDFDVCNPIRWWFTRHAQFPSLHRLACDILSIPGKFSFISCRLCSYLCCRICRGS